MALPTILSLALLAAPVTAQIVGGEVDEVLVPSAPVGHIFAWGDFNQDGDEDLVVRSNNETHLFLGPSFSSSLLSPDARWTGATVLPDLDQDGWLDVLLWNGHQGNFPNEVGRVLAVSSQTGAVLYDLIEARGFGASVVPVHDLDGDGFEDWITVYGVDLGTAYGDQQGRLRACSAATGTTIWESDFGYPSASDYLFDLALIGDLDGDGNRDLVIGSPSEAHLPVGGNSYWGAAHLASSRDGRSLLRLPSTANPPDDFGAQVEGLPDLNGDLVPDLAVSSPERWTTNGISYGGAIEAYSGLDGALLWEVDPNQFLDLNRLGYVMGGDVDLDDDQVPDLWTTFDGRLLNAASHQDGVLFISGRTGELLYLTAPKPNPGQDEEGLGCFDFSGDGSPDFVIPYASGASFLRFVARDRWLHIGASSISISLGGTSAIEVDFPGSARYYLYKVLVSGSGTGPMDVNGVKVPLTYDLLVLQSYLGQLPPITSGFAGVLDSGGDASASIDIPPGSLSANLAGRSFYLAAIAGPPWEWRLSTGYLSLTLVQ